MGSISPDSRAKKKGCNVLTEHILCISINQTHTLTQKSDSPAVAEIISKAESSFRRHYDHPESIVHLPMRVVRNNILPHLAPSDQQSLASVSSLHRHIVKKSLGKPPGTSLRRLEAAQSASYRTSFRHLPVEMIHMILDYMDLDSIKAMLMTCRYMSYLMRGYIIARRRKVVDPVQRFDIVRAASNRGIVDLTACIFCAPCVAARTFLRHIPNDVRGSDVYRAYTARYAYGMCGYRPPLPVVGRVNGDLPGEMSGVAFLKNVQRVWDVGCVPHVSVTVSKSTRDNERVIEMARCQIKRASAHSPRIIVTDISESSLEYALYLGSNLDLWKCILILHTDPTHGYVETINRTMQNVNNFRALKRQIRFQVQVVFRMQAQCSFIPETNTRMHDIVHAIPTYNSLQVFVSGTADIGYVKSVDGATGVMVARKCGDPRPDWSDMCVVREKCGVWCGLWAGAMSVPPVSKKPTCAWINPEISALDPPTRTRVISGIAAVMRSPIVLFQPHTERLFSYIEALGMRTAISEVGIVFPQNGASLLTVYDSVLFGFISGRLHTMSLALAANAGFFLDILVEMLHLLFGEYMVQRPEVLTPPIPLELATVSIEDVAIGPWCFKFVLRSLFKRGRLEQWLERKSKEVEWGRAKGAYQARRSSSNTLSNEAFAKAISLDPHTDLFSHVLAVDLSGMDADTARIVEFGRHCLFRFLDAVSVPCAASPYRPIPFC